MNVKFDPNVWGPHYWFFLHTAAESYPLRPNEVTKRKYYDLIHNMPLFIPVEEMGDKFAVILDKYPVSPYLTNRESFVRWVHFIHNKYNEYLGKDEPLLLDSLEKYREQYKPKGILLADNENNRRKYVHAVFILSCFVLVYMAMQK
jgi:hypothetical protein